MQRFSSRPKLGPRSIAALGSGLTAFGLEWTRSASRISILATRLLWSSPASTSAVCLVTRRWPLAVPNLACDSTITHSLASQLAERCESRFSAVYWFPVCTSRDWLLPLMGCAMPSDLHSARSLRMSFSLWPLSLSLTLFYGPADVCYRARAPVSLVPTRELHAAFTKRRSARPTGRRA